MELSSNSSPALVPASSIELHARTLFDKEVLGDALVECSTNTELLSKLPHAESLSDGFVECETDTEPMKKLVEAEVSKDEFLEWSTNAELVSKLPDVEALSDGFVDCTAELPPCSADTSDYIIGTMPVVEGASIGFPELPGKCQDTMSSDPVEPSKLSMVADSTTLPFVNGVLLPAGLEDFTAVTVECAGSEMPPERTTEEREKVRTFPVPLSEGESLDYKTTGDVIPGFSHEGVGRQDYSAPNGVESDKDSGSDSEGDDCNRPSSSNAMHILTAKDKSSSLTDEPLRGILVSKIAELENACTGAFKADDDDSKSVKVRKRQLKEMRALIEGTDRSSEEKLRQLNTKYVQQVAETRKLEKSYVTLNRKYKQVNKEKDSLYAELTKSTALRQKLESLCRELQRQNRMLLDDSKRVASEEEQKRQELSGKFHNTVKDITSKLEEQGDQRLRQLEENELLREKLKHFTQQYDIREQHFAHQLRTKSLEYQLLEVKLKQQEDLYSQSESKSRMYSEQIAQLLKTEQELRSQLALYGDKFEQFQETLTKSNEVFATFKSEMEKMSKTVKKLEKENLSLKKKCEKSDVSIIELLGERDFLKKHLQTTKTQKEKLEGLCRSLQLERKQQLVAVDTTNSSPPSQLVCKEAKSI